jgi:putative ABC transport system ATP-binding protein
MEIGANQTVVLYGPSGSGKTTLLSLLGTLDRPTGGKIFLQGREVTRFSDLELSRIRREMIGFVFQSFNLFSGLSAWENVSYPLIPAGVHVKERFERAAALLERLGLGDRVQHSPEALSGGEQQRVAIARALINNPEILIADEPTSNIDADAVGRLMEILGELKGEGKTIIISSHDPIFKGYGDQLCNLNRGRLDSMDFVKGPP